MRSVPRWIVVAAVLLVVAVIAFFLLRKGGAREGDEEAQLTASVTTAPVRQQTVQDLAPATGVIQPSAGNAITVASPRAAVVNRVFVAAGQAVQAGQPLVALANAPASEQAYRQAQDAESFAERDLARVRRLFDERLAAADQLSAAEKTLADAKAALAAQVAQGAGRASQVVTAPSAAVVASVSASTGDRVAQDAALMVLAREGGLAARLNIEPSDARRVAAGQAVTLKPVFGGAPISTRLATVGRQADSSTRAIDAAAPVGAELPVGASVQAQIVTGSHPGLLVPRASVVFDETGPHVFTIAGGKAHRVFVQVGADQGEDEIEIRGKIAPGTAVAVQGAYELEDGMSVRTGTR
jgi:RND family efflux transporter MFP subunit